jgi:isochorismate synthase EntC
MINLKELAQSIFSLPGALLRDQDYIYYYSNLQEVELNKAQVFAFDYFGGGHGFKGSIQKFHVSELKNPFWDISDQVNFISPDHSLFIKTVLGLKSRIKDKEFDKAVPFFFSQGKNQINSEILWKIWSNLLHAPLTLNSYAIWTDKWGMMGASPETLFEKQNKSISTMALAGTFARNQISSDQIESLDHLLSDPKERFEHEIVVRDLVQVLQQWGASYNWFN